MSSDKNADGREFRILLQLLFFCWVFFQYLGVYGSPGGLGVRKHPKNSLFTSSRLTHETSCAVSSSLNCLTLSVPMVFHCFFTFRNLVVIQLILAIKAQTIYQMKDIVHGSLLVESIFEITSEKGEKSVFKNPIF